MPASVSVEGGGSGSDLDRLSNASRSLSLFVALSLL